LAIVVEDVMNRELGREAEVAAVQARREHELMSYPNVVGLATGRCARGGKQSEEPCLLVFVERKRPEDDLEPGGVLPREIDGVPVDVVEVGTLKPLPSQPVT
jgi:hypothetical protein